MDVIAKFPLTHLELLEMGHGELVRFPATFNEYWELLGEAEYRVDFYNNEIIAMSHEPDLHSEIVTQMSHLLKTIFPGSLRKQFKVHNSNRPVCIPACDYAVFNPDGSVVLQPPVYYEYQPGMNAETNPLILFEVLSKNTRDYDWNTKLPCFKKIPTLRQIIFIDSQRLFVTVYERNAEVNKWENSDYDQPDAFFYVQGQPIKLDDLYQGIFS